MERRQQLQYLFKDDIIVNNNLVLINKQERHDHKEIIQKTQKQTKEAFDSKWGEAARLTSMGKLHSFQKEWFLSLYGFNKIGDLRNFLAGKKTIVDAGCGLGYKSAWLAELAPHVTIIGIDLSDAVLEAAKTYRHLQNLYFVQQDIAHTSLTPGAFDFVLCDQVIMHTQFPDVTFDHLASLLSPGGEFACYVYRRKAIPRELLDDYFRRRTSEIPDAEMWEFASQVTELGQILNDLNVEFECPEIPLLDIKGGRYTIQRFLYWNFLKCFWRDDWGGDLCTVTNYDWYAPSNAQRFSKEEFLGLAERNGLETIFFHEEEACYSGRFKRNGYSNY